jgi:hypothetical protein
MPGKPGRYCLFMPRLQLMQKVAVNAIGRDVCSRSECFAYPPELFAIPHFQRRFPIHGTDRLVKVWTQLNVPVSLQLESLPGDGAEYGRL